MPPSPASPLEQLDDLLSSIQECEAALSANTAKLVSSCASLDQLTSPMSASASSLVVSSSNITDVISELTAVQKQLSLPSTSPAALLKILNEAPHKSLSFPPHPHEACYHAHYEDPDPSHCRLSWKNGTLPQGLLSDAHWAYGKVCETLARTSKVKGIEAGNMPGRFSSYLAAKQLQESGLRARLDWLAAFEGLIRCWSGETSGMRGDDDAAAPPPAPSPVSPSSPPGTPFSPPRRARRSVSFSPPPVPLAKARFLPKSTATSLRRLLTLLTTATSHLYHPPMSSFLTSSPYATPPDSPPSLPVSYLLSHPIPPPPYLRAALAREQGWERASDRLYSWTPTNLRYLDA